MFVGHDRVLQRVRRDREWVERPKSRPISWSHRHPKGGWRLKLDARARRPKGALSLWTRVRRLVWSWWPWAIVSIWGIADDRLGWALGGGIVALLAYLTAPAALPPRYGLSHEFDVES